MRIFRFLDFFDLIPSSNFQDVLALKDDAEATPTPVGLLFTPAAAFVGGGTVIFPVVPSLDSILLLFGTLPIPNFAADDMVLLQSLFNDKTMFKVSDLFLRTEGGIATSDDWTAPDISPV